MNSLDYEITAGIGCKVSICRHSGADASYLCLMILQFTYRERRAKAPGIWNLFDWIGYFRNVYIEQANHDNLINISIT